ncbi:MAG: N-acetylmuramic acid 6-phosphate etherase [Elusimicrobia bacterium]|nr:N-acetylmuramic acid 6-phosphate etherase [Elusimicrobiota bacterium]
MYHKLPTEKSNSKSKFLDTLTPQQIFSLMNQENFRIPKAIANQKEKIIKAIDLMAISLKNGGRIFFVGAGTSGRLGVLESAELPPTFDTPPSLAQAWMAGGKKSVFRSKEGAEDEQIQIRELVSRKVKKNDLVIGIAASGITPFVLSALEQAKKINANTILITCNSQKSIANAAQVVIALEVGSEIIAGSTRLKSGTATKMVLNMLTTISMVRLGKVYGNRMVDLQARSKKLKERGIRLVQEIAGLNRSKALTALAKAHWNVKTAIVMVKKNLSYDAAKTELKRQEGFLTKILQEKF